MKRGQTLEAIDCLQKISKEHSRYHEACLMLGDIYLKMRQFEHSFKWFAKATDCPVLAEKAYLGIILIQIELKQFHLALQFADAALSFYPANPSFFYLKCCIYSAMGNIEKSLETLGKINLIFFHDEKANQILSDYYQKIGDFHNALVHLKNEYIKRPANVEVLERIIRLHFKLGNFGSLEAWLDTLGDKSPDESVQSDLLIQFLAKNMHDSRNAEQKNAFKLALLKFLTKKKLISSPSNRLNQACKLRFGKNNVRESDESFKSELLLGEAISYSKKPDFFVKKMLQTFSTLSPAQFSILSVYSDSLRTFIRQLLLDKTFLGSAISNKEETFSINQCRFIMESVYFTDYTRHAINCDVLTNEYECGNITISQLIKYMEELVTKKTVHTFIHNLSLLTSALINIDTIIDLLVVDLAQHKLDVVLKSKLLPRQSTYLENLFKYIKHNSKLTQLPNREFFFRGLQIEAEAHKSHIEARNLALTHFFGLCMQLARLTLAQKEIEDPDFANELLSMVKSGTRYENPEHI